MANSSFSNMINHEAIKMLYSFAAPQMSFWETYFTKITQLFLKRAFEWHQSYNRLAESQLAICKSMY